jgi:diadenosine tetraphosphatase ApaH/serine/threonine PP2A family protein phosphatase
VLGDYTLVHGSPREPIWEYVLDPLIAALNFKHFRTTYCFVGHTHSPVAFRQVSDLGECEQVLPTYDTPIPLGDKRQIVNPGSTGQPRDSNPRAAYAILNLDDDTLERRRVEYDIEAVQVKMEAEGLPERMIMRLSHGW